MIGPVLVTLPTIIIRRIKTTVTSGQTNGLSGQLHVPVARILEIKIVGDFHLISEYYEAC